MFLDTTVVIEVFRSKEGQEMFETIFKAIKDEPLFISVLQLGEIADWCASNDVNATERIEKLKEIVNMIPLGEKICVRGSEIKKEMRRKGVDKFSLIDGMILASARSINQKLLTTDTDFRRADDAIVLDKKKT